MIRVTVSISTDEFMYKIAEMGLLLNNAQKIRLKEALENEAEATTEDHINQQIHDLSKEYVLVLLEAEGYSKDEIIKQSEEDE